MRGTYIQIGAGAGDQDKRINFRDGFTEYVKSLDPRKIGKIILVEPNPANIPALRKCWKDYPQAEIRQMGIRVSDRSQKEQVFYYAEEDAPHFQVFSLLESHVRKHYPNGAIRSVTVPTVTIAELLSSVPGPVDLLALDIEGIDAQILAEIPWATVSCRRVSFEFIHLGNQASRIYSMLSNAGYIRTGWGMDSSRFDLLYEKPSSVREHLVSRMKWLFGGWWTIHQGRARSLVHRLKS
jgi:FkbM family methyltransferase